MGVHGLTGLLRRYAPNSLRDIKTRSLANKTIAFDASCHLNKFIYGDDPHEARHIYGFYSMARFCQLHKITPIFVFDGPERLEAKQFEHERRERLRQKVKYSLDYERARAHRLALWTEVSDSYRDISDEAAARILDMLGETLEEIELRDDDDDADTIEAKLTAIARELRQAIKSAEDREKYTSTVRHLSLQEGQLMSDLIQNRIKSAKSALRGISAAHRHMLGSYEKRSIRITQELREECIDFLNGIGFACFSVKNHEAEAMCANLAKEEKVDAIVTEDMDTLVFGDAPILRYFFARGRPILEVDPIIARRDLGMTRDQFVDMCILCGTDFSATISGIGPIRALEMIRRYGSIEHVLDNLSSRYEPNHNFNYIQARKAFNSLPDIPIDDKIYHPPPVDHPTLEKHLIRYHIDYEEVEKKLLQMMGLQNANANSFGPDPFKSAAVPVTATAIILS